MTDDATRPKPKIRFVQSFIDRNGRERHYLRRVGFKPVALPPPSSPDFMLAYSEAMAATATSLTARLRAAYAERTEPLIGVYLLMLKGKVVYIGSSLNMPKRVEQHRSNGRPFDKAHFIATEANERGELEQTLIRALHPSQNRAHRTRPDHQGDDTSTAALP